MYKPTVIHTSTIEPDGLYVYSKNHFAVSYYHLYNERKTGKICSYEYDPTTQQLTELYNHKTPAIHNLNIVDVTDTKFLAASTASSKILFFTVEDALKEVNAAIIPEECEVLCSSVGGELLAASRNDGYISTWRLFRNGRWKPIKERKCHDAEIWSVALQKEGKLMLSGSDDTYCKCWNDTDDLLFKIRFDAGVTDLVWRDDSHFITGCYDGTVSEFDMRNTRIPLWEGKVDGGAGWRIMDYDDRIIVAGACGGIAEFKPNKNGLYEKVFQEYAPHDSMVYGADKFDDDIISCSFYDKKIVLWSHDN
ncbi:methylated diphthine methylhydrolase [Entamoeba marina]